MRNLRKHPIELHEIETCLNEIRLKIIEENTKEQRCGDMRPLLIDAASRIIVRAAFILDGICVVKKEGSGQ